MKILLGCLNVNDLGGSELYHYELARELKAAGEEVTLFSMRPITPEAEIRKRLTDLGIRQIDTRTLDPKEKFNIGVVSQLGPARTLVKEYPDLPFINVIHSELRGEIPYKHPNIVHYIGIRQSIVDSLIKGKVTTEDKISLIYNPIDQSRFNPRGANPLPRITGLFVGEVYDPLRSQAASHLTHYCIEKDWDLVFMCRMEGTFRHPNIKYIPQRWDTESVLKRSDFTGGILMGRTSLESWCCGIPSFMYNVDSKGNILSIEKEAPKNIVSLCDSKFVADQHIELYKKLI